MLSGAILPRKSRLTSCNALLQTASMEDGIDCSVPSSSRRTTFSNLVCFGVLIAAGFTVSSTPARIDRAATCAPCYSAQLSDENFDKVTPPALPTGWLATNTLGPPPLWVTSNSGVPSPPADTSPNSAFIDDPAVVSDKRLDSLSVSILGCCCQLTFRHNFNLEASDADPNVGFDGGVLEFSTDGGNTFRDILAAGGSFVMGGYNRTIAADRGSPIAGRQAWSGNSQGFMTTVVNVPAFAGLILRWRMGSDNSGSGEGWRVDTMHLTWCRLVGCTPPTPKPRPTPPPRPERSAPPSPHATPAFTPVPRPTP